MVNENRAKYNKNEWIGMKFGKMTVIKPIHIENKWKWECKCECGNTRIVLPLKLIKGMIKTCGCGKVERVKELTERYRKTHGGRHERLYYIWRGVKQRCFTSTRKDYSRYGGRGITMCSEWSNDYSRFREWALSHGYSEELSIDRVDVNGNYEPSNCRWVTMKEQQRNRSTTHIIEYNNERMSFPEFCDRYNLVYVTAYSKMFRKGWSAEKIIEEKYKKHIM